jgi:hypothetical protein
MATARVRLLQLPELLEQIIFQLPQCDILVLQRVATKWKDVIAKSKPIQQKLFFEPAEPGEMVVWEGRSPFRRFDCVMQVSVSGCQASY